MYHCISTCYRCCSFVGRHFGYIQPVSIGYNCTFYATVHEIGHVLGFWHEQSRPDRDKYINIHQNNIIPGHEYNFDKETSVNSLGVPYDFSSIMHYGATAFAKFGTVSISTKEKNIPFGRATELSPLDIKQTNLLYKKQCGLLINLTCTKRVYEIIIFLLGLRSSSVSKLPAKSLTTSSPVTLPRGRCNKHLIGKTGWFYPPDNSYKSNTDCVWIIKFPKGYYFQLIFYDIELQ